MCDDAHDLDALKRAMVQARRQGEFRAQQIDSRLASEPWEEVAKFASYTCQIKALGLRPWEDTPCHGDIDGAQRQHCWQRCSPRAFPDGNRIR